MRLARLLLWLLLTATTSARPGEASLHGYLDCRWVAAPDAKSWTAGGLGKTRFGAGGTQAMCAQGGLVGRWQITPSMVAVADLQYVTKGPDNASVLEAYLRYRPVSTTRWRTSLKVGEFFPPISLENTAIGWTSPWTLTPSAINSWVGEELRGFGAEGQLEWRTPHGSLTAVAAALRSNDPAGELLSARGWSLSDLTAGWGTRVREPDVYAIGNHAAVPLRFNPFLENDARLGWYAGGSWQASGSGTFSVLRYDNRADPSSHSSGVSPVFSWRTRFWSVGAQTDWRNLTVLAQAMSGSTDVAPVPAFSSSTPFRAAYVLLGYTFGRWRLAVRVDGFSTDQLPRSLDRRAREHGSAGTCAVNWKPVEWLRLTAEVVMVRSNRNQRIDAGDPPFEIDRQLQLGARLYF
ncbi:MAG: hypothetical protein ABW187_09300 [Dokdonella sp.]